MDSLTSQLKDINQKQKQPSQETQKTQEKKQSQQEQPLDKRIDQIVGLLPEGVQGIVTDLLQVINNQGQAITSLQNQVLTLAESIKASGHGYGVGKVDNQPSDDIEAPTRIVETEAPDNGHNQQLAIGEVKQATQGNSLEQLKSIMEMIRGTGGMNSMFGGKPVITADMIEGLVAQRDAINKLIPQSPYEEMATKLGIKVLDKFASQIGTEGLK